MRRPSPTHKHNVGRTLFLALLVLFGARMSWLAVAQASDLVWTFFREGGSFDTWIFTYPAPCPGEGTVSVVKLTEKGSGPPLGAPDTGERNYCCSLDAGAGDNESPVVGGSAASGHTETGVNLLNGYFALTRTDATIPLRGPDWRNILSYSSSWRAGYVKSGTPDTLYGATNVNGYRWYPSSLAYIVPSEDIPADNRNVVLSNRQILRFKSNGSPPYTGPYYDFGVGLEGANAGPAIADVTLTQDTNYATNYKLHVDFVRTGARMTFGPNPLWQEDIDESTSNWSGFHNLWVLLEQVNPYGDTVTYGWEDAHSTDDPPTENHNQLAKVTMYNGEGTNDWAVTYEYIDLDDGNNPGKLERIKVFAGPDTDPTGGTDDVIKQIEYTYDDDSEGNWSADLGSEGDLVLIKVMTRGSDDTASGDMTESKARVEWTHYRYHVTDTEYPYEHEGHTHQLKAIFSSATIEAMLDADPNDGVTEPTDLLELDDVDEKINNVDVEDYADTWLTYHIEQEDTTDLPVTGEDLEDKYDNWASDSLNETDTDVEWRYPVKTITIGANCEGCGGASAGTYAYHYMQSNYQYWDSHNGCKRLVVEDRPDGSRMVYGVSTDGILLRTLFEDDYDADPGPPNRWYYSKKVYDGNADGVADIKHDLVAEVRTHSAHDVDTNNVWKFFDEDYDDGGTGDPSEDVIRSSAGLIRTFDYNSDGRLEWTKIKQGYSGTEINLEKHEYHADRPALVTKHVRYRTETSQTTATNQEVVDYTYTFYDVDNQKTKTKTATYEPVSDNGPGVSAVFEVFYDDHGQLRWKRDAEGYVTYFGYDDDTGVTDLQVVDVNTSTLPTAVDDDWDGTDYGYATDDTVPFSRTGGGTALNLDTVYELDDLGRVTKVTDPDLMITYTKYLAGETRVYPAWNATTDKPLLPMRITKYDDGGRVIESILADPASITFTDPPDAGSTETSSISQADYVQWTVNDYDVDSRLTNTRRYHDIPSSGDGTLITNYYETIYQYDSSGERQYQIDVINDGSGSFEVEQVTKWTHDAHGRVTKIEEGVSSDTHDMGSDYDTYPTLRTVQETYYDDPDSDSTPEQGEGNGQVSWVRRYFGSTANDSVLTQYVYDWRGRTIVTLNWGSDASGDATTPTAPETVAPHTLAKVDNLGRVLATGLYSNTNLEVGDDPTTLAADGTTKRVALSETAYDQMGRVYKTTTWEVNASTGAKGIDLVTNTYHDRNSRIVAVDAPNTGVIEHQYDGAGRETATRWATALESTTYTSGAFNYLDDDENIVQVVEQTYDDASNVTKTITKELNHDDTDGMDLTNNDDYIRTHVYRWYDDAHRLTDAVNYGTYSSDGWKDNSTAPTYGSSAPSRSDTVLVTTNAYNGAGLLSSVTDPASKVTAYTYDDLGRTTQLEEADGTADERVTKYEYDGNGSLTAIKAFEAGEYDSGNAGNDTQKTEYVYDTDQNSRWVEEIRYPVSHDAAGTSSTDKVVFTYNYDGTVATRTDQIGNVIAYDYDDLRRVTAAKATTIVSPTDNTVQSVSYTYTSRGEQEYVTNHSDATPDTSAWGDAIAQAKFEYNGLGMLTKEQQDADSEVDDNSGVDTRDTAYEYDLSASSSNNHARLKYVTYPSGRKIWQGYTHTSTASTFQDEINDAFGRAGQIAEDNSGAIGDIIAEYDFNGLSRMIRRTQDDGSGWAGNDTRLDLWGPSESAGDYDGLDRFGRIVDLRHRDLSGSTDLARLKYGYDRVGNRTSAEDAVFKSLSRVYTYDNLHRLDVAQRGSLNSAGTDTPLSDLERDWTLDDLGNQTALETHQVASNVTHAVNSTNEITTYDVPNEAGAPLLVDDPFASEDNDVWTEVLGAFSVNGSNKLEVGSLSQVGGVYYAADVVGDAHLTNAYAQVAATFDDSYDFMGFVFAYEDSSNYWMAYIEDEEEMRIKRVAGGSPTTPAMQTAGDTISSGQAYTFTLRLTEGRVEFDTSLTGGTISYNYSAGFPPGAIGVVANGVGDEFDDFKLYETPLMEPVFRQVRSSSDVTATGTGLTLDDTAHGGLTLIEGLWEDDIILQARVPVGGGVVFRYQDINNYYNVRIETSGANKVARLYRVANGKEDTLYTPSTFSGTGPWMLRVKIDGQDVDAWTDGTARHASPARPSPARPLPTGASGSWPRPRARSTTARSATTTTPTTTSTTPATILSTTRPTP